MKRALFIRTALLPSAAALTCLLSACATSQPMRPAAEVRASQGVVKTTEGDNGTTNVSIRVKHLAPPSRVVPDATVYVVWIQPPNAPKQSLGMLKMDSDREGSLDTVTPHRQFQLEVTPESNGRAVEPSNAPVFTTDVTRND